MAYLILIVDVPLLGNGIEEAQINGCKEQIAALVRANKGVLRLADNCLQIPISETLKPLLSMKQALFGYSYTYSIVSEVPQWATESGE